MKGNLKLDDVPSWPQIIKLCKTLRRIYEKKKTIRALRDFILISLLAKTGVRLGELLQLEKSDFDLKQGIMKIRQLKKRRDFRREVIIPPELAPYLTLYLRSVKGRLFDMTERNARQLVYNYTQRILGKRYRPHAFRHCFAIRILEKTRDLELVRRILGHENYQVLKAYLNFTLRDRKLEIRQAIQSEI